MPKPAGEALEGLAAGLDPAAEGGIGSSDASDLDHIEYYPSGPGSQFVRTDALGSLQLGESLRRSAEFCGQQWQFEAGRVARLADGSCLLRVGHTTLLATAVSGRELHRRRDPLALQFDVEYREKTFAVGRIPSGYNKREGAPKEHEILAGRRVDRALRPLFPKGYAYDTQVSTSVLSADCTLDLDVAAINAASAALMCSDIPWEGPVAAVRVVMDATGKLHVNAPQEGGEAIRVKAGPRLRLMVAATQDRVVMVEAEGAQVPEAEFARALQLGAREARALLPPQLELAAACGRSKRAALLLGADPAAAKLVEKLALGRVEDILRNADLDKTSRARALLAAKQEVLQTLRDTGSFRFEQARVAGSGCVSPSDLDHAFTALIMRTLRVLAVQEGLRPDGRGLIDLRDIHCEVDTIPVVHGSALFSRGETQSLCTATVGGKGDEQRTESLMEGEGAKRLAVHYAFPAFSINETYVNGQRREAGHSSLVERAMLPVLPSAAEFPFPLRLNADTLASNGSSSLAAVCGGSLALADAGVPLRSLVAGVSVGLMTEHCWDGTAREVGGQAAAAPSGGTGEVREWGRYELLTDLMGLEDSLGDMDFKVAGSRAGITACQLDVKVLGGVPESVLVEGLERARVARLAILDIMQSVMSRERSVHSPYYGVVKVNRDSVGRVIGAGGANIKEVSETTGARCDVSSDSGEVRVYAPSKQQFEAAKTRVLELAGENIQEGQRYPVRVVRLADFGAFVEFESGVRTLLHISELSQQRVRSVEDVVSLGDTFEVLCLGRDARGHIKISRKALLENSAAQQQGELTQGSALA